jgi:hypothetical protein
MAVTYGLGSKIYIAQYDVSGEGRSIDINSEADIADATVITSAAREHVSGAVKYSVDHAGIFSASATSWEKWLYDNLAGAAGKGITIIPGTPVEYTGTCYNGTIKEASMKVPIKVDDLIGVNASYQIADSLSRASLVAYQTTAVGAYTGTVVDLGAAASATQMWILCIHIYEVTGVGTSYTVHVEESVTSGGSYADVTGCTLTALSTVPASLCYWAAGTRYQYIKVIGAPSGAVTAKFVVSLGIANLQ